MTTDIAVIGMAGKYPKANSPQKLWDNILNNIDVSESEAIDKENYVNKYYSVENIDLFDNEFFSCTPYESSIMDPQHRILLKCAQEALEHAGYEKEPQHSKIGVFVTTSISTYLLNIILNSKTYKNSGIDYPTLIGNDKDFLSTKISYKLNLTGPSVTIQCACSGSLVAIHYACKSLLNSESDMALVGGISISIPQQKGYFYKEGGILSKDGVCRPFDEQANGTIKGNGCSVIILKKLSNAIKDNDQIYSIIKSTAINNDGSNKIGYTAPSISGESSVIQDAINLANLTSCDIDYIETHGTGTKLGDPIEIKALNNIFCNVKTKIPLGSIKANIGHLDVASGITSIIKSIFILNKDTIPPIKNFNKKNQIIDEITHNFYFPTTSFKKQVNNIVVNSFGIGGTNACAVLSKHKPMSTNTKSLLPIYLVPVCLNKHSDLDSYTKKITSSLKDKMDFCDFVFSMSTGKKRRANTINILARNVDEFLEQLNKSTYIHDNFYINIPLFSIKEYEILRNYLPSFNELCIDFTDYENFIPYTWYRLKFIQFLNKLNVFSSNIIIIDNAVDSDLIKILAITGCQEEIKTIQQSVEEPIKIHTDPLLTLFKFLSKINNQVPLEFWYLYKNLNWQRQPLPSYPLNEKKFWIEPESCENNQSITPKDILEEIIKIWIESTGEQTIDPNTNYLDIGGDSLMAIDIIDKINKRLDVRITTNDFTNNLTPKNLEMLINKNNNNDNCISLLRKSEKTKKSIFLIHPAGGTTFCYNMMNRYLLGEYSLYSIDLPENYNHFLSIEQLAAHYLKEIKKYQSGGSYIIGGYSFGGNLAYEIAAKLEREQLTVNKVIMFDSHPPVAYNTYAGEEINYNEVFPEVINYYFNNTKIGKLEKTLYKKKSIKDMVVIMKDHGVINDQLNNEEIIKFYNKWIFSHNLLKEYIPQNVISSDVIVFAAKEKEDMEILNNLKITWVDKGVWKKYFNGKLKTIPIHGNHYNIFSNEYNLKYLAKHFDDVMVN